MLADTGYYSERNVQKLLDIIRYVPHLLDSMDNNERIVNRFHELAMDAKNVWCDVTYAQGHIELRLDTPHLAGIHLLGAIEAVAGMARGARVPPTPGSAYR